jgi:hypothetical protein
MKRVALGWSKTDIFKHYLIRAFENEVDGLFTQKYEVVGRERMAKGQ